jgi:hypothetical protein
LTDEALDEALSRPTSGALKALEQCPGDILILDVAGKMGLTLAQMAHRALDQLERRDKVIGVARFPQPQAAAHLNALGVETIRCDLLDRDSIQALPDAPNVLFWRGKSSALRAGRN